MLQKGRKEICDGRTASATTGGAGMIGGAAIGMAVLLCMGKSEAFVLLSRRCHQDARQSPTKWQRCVPAKAARAAGSIVCGAAPKEGKGECEISNQDSIVLSRESEQVVSRRDFMAVVVGAAMATTFSSAAYAEEMQRKEKLTLEDINMGQGRWNSLSSSSSLQEANVSRPVPAEFCTYGVRILVRYDSGVASWWQSLRNEIYSPTAVSDPDRRSEKLRGALGAFARSLQLSLERYLVRDDPSLRTQDIPGEKLLAASVFSSMAAAPPELEVESRQEWTRQRWNDLAFSMANNYCSGLEDADRREVLRQLSLLFAMLPTSVQPLAALKEFSAQLKEAPANGSADTALPTLDNRSLTELLPLEYSVIYDSRKRGYSISPSLELSDAEGLSTTKTVVTPFGPLSSMPLAREMPVLPTDVYARLGLSGALGCALTHTVVIPLDVVKTKMQTDPDRFRQGSNLLSGAADMVQQDGWESLLLGTQATIAGYLWYGLSVYPTYAFLKKASTTMTAGMPWPIPTPAAVAAHPDTVALLAGAAAAVVASVGLTPLEACRIRAVADPASYRDGGLLYTMRAILAEGEAVEGGSGWQAIYAGFPSLLTRQVIFGSVKFLAFERACDAIYRSFPWLHNSSPDGGASLSSLAVSLVAGGFAGALSSVVSQPADTVLTYVAQQSGEQMDGNGNGGGGGGMGVIAGGVRLVQEDGVVALFRGLGSRCVWAGSILAGQFLLYDVFRNLLGVSVDNLSQVFELDI